MAEEFIKRSFHELPTWSKGVIVVGGMAIVSLVGYTIYKNAQKRKDLRESDQAGQLAAQEIGTLIAAGVSPSYSDSQYEVFAQALTQAMAGCGTDENAVYGVFGQLKNKVDVLRLIQVFGVRFYTPCAASQPVSWVVSLFNDKAFGGGLPTWLSYDMTSGEIGQINSILKSKGINYSF